ncbi:MAG: V-type ATP synthase subunit D, partial [Candidatus Omnitrophota bacterium]
MAKIKLTKTEFKKQRDALKRYVHFLPTLLLKKQQLQLEVQKIHRAVEEVIREKEYFRAVVYKWVDVFAEKTGIEKLIKIKEIITTTGNIAGVDIP